MKVIYFIGALIYSAFVCFLLWLMFYWSVPFIMSIKWWHSILLILFGGSIVIGILGAIASILMAPLLFLCQKCSWAKISIILPALYFGIYSVVLPWIVNMEYGLGQWISAVFCDIVILTIFISAVTLPMRGVEDV